MGLGSRSNISDGIGIYLNLSLIVGRTPFFQDSTCPIQIGYPSHAASILEDALMKQYPQLNLAQVTSQEDGGRAIRFVKLGGSVGGRRGWRSDATHSIANFPSFTGPAYGRDPAASSSPW